MAMSRSEAGKLGGVKSTLRNKELKKSRMDKYNLNPSICKGCDQPLPYEKRSYSFCSKPCYHEYKNGLLTVPIKQCKNCGSDILGKNRHKRDYCCQPCFFDFQKKEKLDRFKNGDTNFGLAKIKRMLIEVNGHACYSCENSKWMSEKIPLEIHHIDGDANNNNEKNLSLLCPNCHALTDNYKSKNKNSTRSYRKKYYDPV